MLIISCSFEHYKVSNYFVTNQIFRHFFSKKLYSSGINFTLSLHPLGSRFDDGHIAVMESDVSSNLTHQTLSARCFIAFTRLLKVRGASSIGTLQTATSTLP